MNIAIIYDSSAGTTAKAAETMGKTMEAQGHQCRVQSVAEADPADVSEADLICIGSHFTKQTLLASRKCG